MINKVNKSICPLCEKVNLCDVKSEQRCWCMNTQVPKELIEKVPLHLKNINCICNECITRYHQEVALNGNHSIINSLIKEC